METWLHEAVGQHPPSPADWLNLLQQHDFSGADQRVEWYATFQRVILNFNGSYSMNFFGDSSKVGVASNFGTVHIHVLAKRYRRWRMYQNDTMS